MAFVQSLLSNPSIPVHERLDALDRIHSDPGIPNSLLSTESFWLKYLHPKLARAKSHSLPSQADIVIIGSGITAASIARSVLQSGQPSESQDSVHPRIIILEARDLCSGATGRNGGHILETAEDFADLVEEIGLEPAIKVTRLRLSHVNELLKVAEEFGLTEEAQVRCVEFLSAHFSETRWEEVSRSIELFKETMPVESDGWKIIPRNELLKNYSLSRAAGIIAGPAGALWPYKFVTGLLSRLQEQYPDDLIVETNTPVTAIQHDVDVLPSQLSKVVTPRGSIRCRHVIHCTNAHVSHLVPSLRGRIYPVRGHMSVQSPDVNFVSQATNHSWLFNYDTGFDYLTQLPPGVHSTNEMMLGGGFASSEHIGIKDIGIATDDTLCSSVTKHLSTALGVVFDRITESVQSSHKVQSVWVGNMGFSADGFPWVGRLPESCTNRNQLLHESDNESCHQVIGGQGAHEWVCAGFSGEGMVHAWRCGTALATMLLKDDGVLKETDVDLSWFPEEMLVTDERIKRSVLPQIHSEVVVLGDSAPVICKEPLTLTTSSTVVTVQT